MEGMKTIFSDAKDIFNKIIKCIIILSILIVLLSILIIFNTFKPSVTNNYNIEHVDTLIIPDSNDMPIISDKPFTNNTSTNVTIYPSVGCSDVSYSDMGYSTPVFKFIPIKINNWTVTKDIQEKLYNKCKKYNINYIQTLAIMYKEGARNNQYSIHINTNGTKDIGLMQFNSSNKDIIKRMTNSTDIEWLKDIDINLECACYLISRNETYYDEVESLYDSLVMYNGGLRCLQKIKSGEYTLQSPASLYAAKVISYMNELYRYYLNSDV